MASLQHKIRAPKTRRGKKFLENRAPKINENDKNTLVFKGSRTSDVINNFIKSVVCLKSPNVEKLKRNNPVLPFEDNAFISSKIPSGAKPMLIFSGEAFDEPHLECLKSCLIDIFRGPVVKSMNTFGVEHQIHFIALGSERILMEVRSVNLKPANKEDEFSVLAPNGTHVVPEFNFVGPFAELTLRRYQMPKAEMMKQALKTSRGGDKPAKKQKNVSTDEFGSKVATVHLERNNEMDELRPGKSMRTALTGKRKRGFERHSTAKQQKTALAEKAKAVNE